MATSTHPHPTQGLAGPDTVAWKINREIVLLLGWGPAILMQFAHPMVAAGVADHSLFRRERRGRLRRLHGTIEAMLALTFGTSADAQRSARGINAIHDRVNGHLADGTSHFPRGTYYSAHDPALLRWVHATILDRFPATYETYVGPLGDEAKDRYCREARGIAPLLGIPDGYLPDSVPAVQSYLRDMLASGTIQVTPTARMLAREVVWPPFPAVGRPLLGFMRLATVGLLPPEFREAYGFHWGPGQEAAFRRSAPVVRRLLPLVPPVARYWPVARAAYRRARQA